MLFFAIISMEIMLYINAEYKMLRIGSLMLQIISCRVKLVNIGRQYDENNKVM